MADIETYKGKINEYVDWLSGNDELLHRNVSNGLPVDGSSIMELLRDRLKKPIIIYDDETAGLFRIFSSETARDKWISGHNPQSPDYDPEGTDELEIFNFDRPSDFVLSTNLSSDPRYIIKGSSNSDASELVFTVSLKDKEGQIKSDGLIITYTITNNLTGITKSVSEPYSSSYVNNPDNPIRINLYKYLLDGINSVNINIKANTVSNSIDVGFSIYLINFSLSSTFDFNIAKTIGADISVPFEVNRSSVVSGSTLKVSAYIDGTLAKLSSNNADAIWTTTDTSARINGTINIKNTYSASTVDNPHTNHTLRLEAEMVSGNTIFYSNVLFYTFEIASNALDIVNRFANIAASIAHSDMVIDDGELVLKAEQYIPINFNWSYYTDQILNQQAINITWAIVVTDSNQEIHTYNMSTETGAKNIVNEFNYIPEFYIANTDDARLVALFNGVELDSWPITVSRSNLVISEKTGYDLKLSAYGKNNSSPDRDLWTDEDNNVSVIFSPGVTFDNNIGWDENSFITKGTTAYATVGYCPFPSNFSTLGRTFEIDFKSEQVNNEDDILIDMGSPNNGRIVIYPTRACVYLNGEEKISTHYKSNERIRLCFIFNKAENGQDGNLIYIINNGILERAASIGSAAAYTNVNGTFKIGGSQSLIRVYKIMAYPFALNYSEAYDNWLYDNDDKVNIIDRNNIVSGGSIIYEECAKKIDTLLIEGDLSRILDRDTNKEDSESTVNITRHCVADPSKDFTVINGMIRKHGQSTLNYPITSMKIWFNKSATDGVNPTVTLSSLLTAMALNKNRYIMKDGAIPANKFVPQANYADSSGANNGSLQRLINDTWYNAVIDGEYKLRTAPQLFSSGLLVNHNNENLGEINENAWVEGYGTDKGANKTWSDIAIRPFPYKIRIAPDSFPCAVFYRNTTGNDNSIHFLGQYVFMDDKKSDHVYGERSIYHYYDETDPFCLKTDNKDLDKKANRVWNNNKTIRIEVVLLDNILTSYMNFNVPAKASDSVNSGNVPCDTIQYDNNGNPVNFYWEDYFEMIYPDPDDFEITAVDGQGNKITDANGKTIKIKEDKFAVNSQFREKAQYFIDFLQWITGIASLNSGTKIAGTNVTLAALDEFIATASQHLDVYKLAAYYIFFLRFGLVDSVERNAQLYTFDGVHWFYGSWDMDIAIGDKNNGGFAFNPPMNRDTKLPTDASIYAFSGRSTTTSNVLWDCLEAWPYWADTIVPKVAQALYDAGLNYDNIVNMFDKEYSEKWSEVMYNASGHYKYIDMRGNDNDWLAWLQGSRTSHRHWWLSVSMNYYDAYWTVGDFNNHRIYLAVTKDAHAENTDLVTIKPTSDTFFKFTLGDGTTSLGVKHATRELPAVFDVSLYAFNKKDPTHIYGATFIEELDLSCFALKLETITLTGAYDNVLGASIKKLNIGIPITETLVDNNTIYSGYVSGTRLTLSATSNQGDALATIKDLDITGQQTITDTESLLYTNNRRTLENFYAIGSGLTSFSSSRSGNKFNTLKLPAMTIKENSTTHETTVSSVLNSIRMINSSWLNISFWTTNTTDSVVVTGSAEDDTLVVLANPATFDNTGIPATLKVVEFTGSTASNLCAAVFIMGWIASIENAVRAECTASGTTYTDELLYQRLNTYTLIAENISWGTAAVPINITYNDLAKLAAFNNGNNQNNFLKGYIKISDLQELTPVQLSQLREWFGESVFNKSNISSGLIIDQEVNYIQVSVGRNSYIDTDGLGNPIICLNEGDSATLNATKFILSEDTYTYTWVLTSLQLNISASLIEGNDGIMRIVTEEGTQGDYDVTVTAYSGQLSKSVDIHIIGVTYPTDWKFGVTGVNSAVTRKFAPSTSVATSIFGSTHAYLNNSQTLRDTYILYGTNKAFEFYVEPVNGTGKTATLQNVQYEVTSLDTIGNLLRTGYAQLATGDTTFELIDEQYLYYNRNATHTPISGIVLGTRGSIPSTIKRYVVTARITIGGMTEVRYLNLIALDDNVPIVIYNPVDPLYVSIKDRIDTMNPNDTVLDIYKTDLMALDGELDFTDSGITSFTTANIGGNVDTIFKYLPYIETLTIDDCTDIAVIDNNITGANKKVFDFSSMANLKHFSMNNTTITYSNVEDSIFDFTNNTLLLDIDTTGCQAGIKITDTVAASPILTIILGSPTYIYIKGTTLLNTITVTSNTNLTEAYIDNVNVSVPKGFNVFNQIF